MHDLSRCGSELGRYRPQDQTMAAMRAGERIVAAAFDVDVADLRAPGRGARRTAAGHESTSAISPSILTSLVYNASVRNNEIPAPV